MEIFITSDLHLSHDKSFIYEARGFKSIYEHNEEVIKRWNSVVSDEDVVYILGDLMLCDNESGIECLRKLKGEIHIIAGNHDSDKRIRLYQKLGFVFEGYATLIKKGKKLFYLSHYPTIVTNGEEKHGPWCLCGHTHIKDKFADIDKRCYHVELDAHNCTPVNITQIIKDIKDYREVNKNG